MAITQTGAMYKSLSFDNTSSRSYGVYITGQAVFNAPERDVEMISIPGRNGAFALDKGRFENITVTYPAGIFAQNEADFAQAISDFRNFLCSKKGYCRLTDEYNPSEYRMAIYKSGLEVEPAQLRAGEFEIVFECMPQRYLTSGETAVSVASGGTLTNPTLFEASPLLEIEGYGTINVNGTEIEIDDELVGDVVVADEVWEPYAETTVDFPNIYIATNDLIEINDLVIDMNYHRKSGSYSISNMVVTNWQGAASVSPIPTLNGDYMSLKVQFDSPITFHYGTPHSAAVATFVKFTLSNNVEYTKIFSAGAAYDGNKTIKISIPTFKEFYLGDVRCVPAVPYINSNTIVVHSTATTFGHPTYIDCDLGEAYAINSGVISSLNSYIALGSQLPALAPGSNTITYDNTITSLKVAPRWWKV